MGRFPEGVAHMTVMDEMRLVLRERRVEMEWEAEREVRRERLRVVVREMASARDKDKGLYTSYYVTEDLIPIKVTLATQPRYPSCVIFGTNKKTN